MITFWGIALLLHMLGIIVLSGGAVGGLILDRVVWRNLATAPQQAAAAGRVSRYFPIVAQLGAAVMLLSGVLLLAARNWAFVGQPWLTLKLALFILLLLNGMLVAKPAGQQLGQLMPQWLAQQTSAAPPAAPAGTPLVVGAGGAGALAGVAAASTELSAALARVRRRLTLFHLTQNLMMFTVFALAVFKFN
jgi:uncharacterized membrane protein SirB2